MARLHGLMPSRLLLFVIGALAEKFSALPDFCWQSLGEPPDLIHEMASFV
ncbi:hypothetical protein ACW9YV_22295 (plasmid) [Paraburkholderia strydomiana]|uniref:Uncharacterized protein n=1 Tax=Paraburkholderia caledonica TaxID=134536 RepID=A0AB73IA96_9BURK|nr:hypothetical protein [Paraburkholderia caledonica]